MEYLQWLPQVLLPWYDAHKRDLPWRADREPYHVWLSEIMLQQTRVEAVKGYFARFLDALPTLEALAECPDEVLYKLWEGLGYYSRVRNLKKAAQMIQSEYGGVFPEEYAQVRALPGIGDYTAGAVCSICFQQKKAAVDGNVLRVVSRLTDDATPIDNEKHKQAVRQALEAIYPDRAGDFTQALMELGATVCGPNKAPDCGNCPCREKCLGYLRGTAASLPIKAPKKQRKTEEKTVFLLCWGDYYALTKRPDTGLLAGMWQLPEIPGKQDAAHAVAALEVLGVQVTDVLRQLDKSHIFTHIQWDMRCFFIEVSNRAGCYTWFTADEIDSRAALPTAYRQFWQERENRHV